MSEIEEVDEIVRSLGSAQVCLDPNVLIIDRTAVDRAMHLLVEQRATIRTLERALGRKS